MESEIVTESDRIVVVGITGNIGSGKSAVAELIRGAGHTVFSSDETAQRLMRENADLKRELKRNFGDDIYSNDASIDRSKLAALVFGNSSEHHARLALLNRLVHPRVLDEHRLQIEKSAEQGAKLVFIESALLFEVGLEDAFDYIVVVSAPEDVRLQRAMLRSGDNQEKIENRMKEQLSSEEKVENADFVINNSSSLEMLAKTVASLLPILEVLPPRNNDEAE